MQVPRPSPQSSDLSVWSGLHDLSFQEVAWEFPGSGKFMVLNAPNNIIGVCPYAHLTDGGPETE